MVTKSSAEYITHRQWLGDVVGGSGLILCYTSALECLNLFLGYLDETRIDVYAKERGEYENINYRIRDSLVNLDIIPVGNLLCTSINQTINDMLQDFNNIDEQSFLEALSNYYFRNSERFDGLVINPENMNLFNTVKQWALEYHAVS